MQYYEINFNYLYGVLLWKLSGVRIILLWKLE